MGVPFSIKIHKIPGIISLVTYSVIAPRYSST